MFILLQNLKNRNFKIYKGENVSGNFSNGHQKLTVRPRDLTFEFKMTVTDDQELSESFGTLNYTEITRN